MTLKDSDSMMVPQGGAVDSALRNEITQINENVTEEMAVCEHSIGTEPYDLTTVSVVNSSQVQIGNNIYYHGPVTLNQIKSSSNGDLAEPPNTHEETSKSIRPKQKKWYIIIGIVAVVLIVLCTHLSIVSSFTRTKSSLNNSTIPMREYSIYFNESAESYPNRTRIYDRSVWTNRGPSEKTEQLRTPVPVVMIIHSATSTCTSFETCTEMIRGFQEFHMDTLHLEDIGYNFLIGGEGRIYEGRGWDKIGGHTYRWNRNSTGICLIGNFMNVEPSPQQISSTHKLIQLGVHLGKISPDYKLLAHRQAIRTESPGQRLFVLMADWPHFSSSLDPNQRDDHTY